MMKMNFYRSFQTLVSSELFLWLKSALFDKFNKRFYRGVNKWSNRVFVFTFKMNKTKFIVLICQNGTYTVRSVINVSVILSSVTYTVGGHWFFSIWLCPELNETPFSLTPFEHLSHFRRRPADQQHQQFRGAVAERWVPTVIHVPGWTPSFTLIFVLTPEQSCDHVETAAASTWLCMFLCYFWMWRNN